MGTLLAALGCFAVVVWFWQISAGGVLEQPKPNQTPMDSFKPALLWMQVGVVLLAGVLLLATAYRLGRSTTVLSLPVKNEPARYGHFSRFIHWLTAILFIVLIPMGIFASMIPEDAWFRSQYYVLHKTLGVVVFALLIVRLLWNRYSKRPQLDETLKPWEGKWARRVHVALYVMPIAVPVTGYVMTSLHGYGTFIFFWEVPTPLAESKAYIVWGLLHKYVLQYALYVILGGMCSVRSSTICWTGTTAHRGECLVNEEAGRNCGSAQLVTPHRPAVIQAFWMLLLGSTPTK